MGLVIPLVLACALAFISFRLYKNQASAKPAPRKNRSSAHKSSATNPVSVYRCVEIKADSSACEAAKSYQNKKILMSEAPVLPLGACTNSHCDCRFIRFDDRRDGERRETLFSTRQDIMSNEKIANNNERRTRRSRRKPQAPKN